MGWFSLGRDQNIQAEIKDPGEGNMGILESSLLGPRFGKDGIKDTGEGQPCSESDTGGRGGILDEGVFVGGSLKAWLPNAFTSPNSISGK